MMKKKYFLSMLSVYLLSFAIDCVYFTSHKSWFMFISMIIPNILIYGILNLIGAHFIYKPIDRLFDGKGNIETAKKRVERLSCYSTLWVFLVGILEGAALLISVFMFDMASDVANMEYIPAIYFISIIPSTIFTSAILPAFIVFFLINYFSQDLKKDTYLKYDIHYKVGTMQIGKTLFFILFILCFFPILTKILDLIATATMTPKEYAQLMDLSYIETSLNEQYVLLMGIVFAVLLIPRTFTKPIYSLLKQIDKVSHGDYSSRAPITSNDEIGLLTEKFNSMVQELELANKKQIEYSKTLEKNLERLNIEILERENAQKLAKLHQEKLFKSEKMASVGILVSGVAHEINNPNNFILLNSDNLADVWDDLAEILDKYQSEHGDFMVSGLMYSEIKDEIPTIINGVKEGSNRIKKIVQTLKDFAKKDPGSLDQNVNIEEMLDASVTILANVIKKCTDNFEIKISDNLSVIKGNIQQLEQVVINLISNSCQSLESRDQKISVSTSSDDNYLSIIVKDEGKGIAENDMKYILDPFFTTKRDSGGTGLGLSISYNIVKDHGGELNINSDLGKGTVAEIKLPVSKTNSFGRK